MTYMDLARHHLPDHDDDTLGYVLWNLTSMGVGAPSDVEGDLVRLRLARAFGATVNDMGGYVEFVAEQAA